ASSSTRERAEKILADNGILEYFDDLVFGYEVPRGKPYPDIFLKACEKMGVTKTEAIILEDSEAGIDAGYSAEIPVICIPDMKVPDKNHLNKTHLVVKSLYDVIDFLKKPRCSWCNLKNPLYVKYHDEEWGVLKTDDSSLFEMLILEGFQAGLSWECVLNKREAFREAFDSFQITKIISYDEKKLQSLCENKDIIRNKRKIHATVKNAMIFKDICEEFGSFYNYLKTFTNGEIIHENYRTTSPLSDEISKNLKKRGMSFVGSVIIYSYLQAVGIINSHDDGCYKNETV
ncbi:MAG: HAD-IA family hydrolase, partial [Clostridia bacterium]|nr:HAD-IA family hydrolase [Clostridia bacterium]